LQRAYDLAKPFAFLMPITTLENWEDKQNLSKGTASRFFFEQKGKFESKKSTAKCSRQPPGLHGAAFTGALVFEKYDPDWK
jgi:hypothetical protein